MDKYICDWYYNGDPLTEDRVVEDLVVVLNDRFEFDDDVDTYAEYAAEILGTESSALIAQAQVRLWTDEIMRLTNEGK